MTKCSLWLLSVLSMVIATICLAGTVSAVSQDIVISEVQVGDSSSSRLIELFNTSNSPVDITDWCLYHSSASGKSVDKLVCFVPPSDNVHEILSAKSYLVVGSDELGIDADYQITSGLGKASGGHIYLLDSQAVEHDRIGWGDAANPETTAFSFGISNTDHVVERRTSDSGDYIDTDNNQSDFVDSVLRPIYQTGSISEVLDICQNIDGIQVLMPADFEYDLVGNCVSAVVDICPNIDDVQSIVPNGYSVDEFGDCISSDLCLNFQGEQTDVPIGFLSSDGQCEPDGLPVLISELLPNPNGNDSNQEFIELYNPNDHAINLDYYKLLIGPNLEKVFDLPDGSVIDGHTYMVFYNNQVKFSLVNTTSKVSLQLEGKDDGEVEEYTSPVDEMAWALIDGSWQFTNQPTPGTDNLASVLVPAPAVILQPCASNQYRNPDTGRCRLIPSISEPAPCKTGQYRSAETGRCRKIEVEPTLAPCGENQTRNPETNRCRSVLGASTSLQPCADNQVRNPDTNRCKTVVQMTEAPYPVESRETPSSDGYVGWWVAGGVLVLAFGYGAWEWRSEFVRLLQLITRKLTIKK